jgi:hypothetical protein
VAHPAVGIEHMGRAQGWLVLPFWCWPCQQKGHMRRSGRRSGQGCPQHCGTPCICTQHAVRRWLSSAIECLTYANQTLSSHARETHNNDQPQNCFATCCPSHAGMTHVIAAAAAAAGCCTHRLSLFSSSAVGKPPTKTAAEGPGCGSAAETRSITCQVRSTSRL